MIQFWSVHGDDSNPDGTNTDRLWLTGPRRDYVRANTMHALAAGFTELIFQPIGQRTPGEYSARLLSAMPLPILYDFLDGHFYSWLKALHPSATFGLYVGSRELRAFALEPGVTVTEANARARDFVSREIVPVARMSGARSVWFDMLDARTPLARSLAGLLATYSLTAGFEPTPLGGNPYGTAIPPTGRRTVTLLRDIRQYYPGLRVPDGEDATCLVDDPKTEPAELEAMAGLGWRLGACSIINNMAPALLPAIAAFNAAP